MLPKRNLNLDSLRGIMAIMVVISHVEYIRFFFGLPNYFLEPFFFHLGRIGVTGFFVLSGFLITNNLLQMKQEAQSAGAKIKQFYLKRALRILPLYYLIILLSIFVLPHIPALHYQVFPGVTDARPLLDEVGIYYFLMLPQIPIANFTVLPFAEPTWSIGVEEMFYLVIPLFAFFTSFRKGWIAVIALMLVVLKIVLWKTLPDAPHQPIFSFLVLSRFECILVGCIMSCFVAEGSKLYTKLGKIHLSVAFLLLLIAAITVPFDLYVYIHFAVLFGVIILYLHKNPLRWLSNKLLVFIGKISFSIYLAHEIAVVFLLNQQSISPPNENSSVLLYFAAIVFSILLGTVLYKLIEEPFLRLKNKIGQQRVP